MAGRIEPKIEWRKTHVIVSEKGVSKALISEHTPNGGFYASLIYYERRQSYSMSSDRIPHFEIKQETFYGATEDDAFNKLKRWYADHISPQYTGTAQSQD